MADIIDLPPRIADTVDVHASTGETLSVCATTGFVILEVTETDDTPAITVGPILSTAQARQIGRVLLASADDADRMAGHVAPAVAAVQAPPRMSWRIVAAQAALVVAAGALVLAGATVIGMAPLLVPATIHLGYAMVAAAFLSLVAASLF